MLKQNLKSLLLLIHYWAPIGLGWSIVLVIHAATRMPIIDSGFHLYLFSICAAYSFDRIIDTDYSNQPSWLRTTLLLGFGLSTIAGFVLSIHLSAQTFSALLLFSTMVLLYSWIKKLPFIKGLLVAVIWVWAGVALPFNNNHWFAWQFWTMKISLPMVILIACGVILCDFKDIQADAQNGVKSLPVMLGLSRSIWLISVLLIIVAGISLAQHRFGLFTSSLLLLILSQFPRMLSIKALGPLIVDVTLTLPGILIMLHWV